MITKREERDAKQLRKLAVRLHVPLQEAFWTLEVFDKDGELLSSHHQRSHSWTRNAYNFMFSSLAEKDASDGAFGAGLLNGKDTTGAVRSGAYPMAFRYDYSVDDLNLIHGGCRGLAGSVAKGIVAGSGINAESLEDFVLQTLITEGAGAGQLNYATQEAHAITYGGLVLTNTLVRYLNNNSGGDVSINEVGLIASIWISNQYPFLVVRDHLGAVVTVPTTGQCKVTYTVQLTYPA